MHPHKGNDVKTAVSKSKRVCTLPVSLNKDSVKLLLPPCLERMKIFWGGKRRGRYKQIYSAVTHVLFWVTLLFGD